MNSELPFDSLATEYDAWFEGEGRLTFQNEIEAFRAVLPSLPQPWLEIGVGSGRFAQVLGIDTGVDPSIELVKMARSRGITTFLGRGEEKIFDEESFGTVFLIVTLCFLASPFEVLREAKRILIPEGKLVTGVVLKESLWGQFYQRQKTQGHRFYKYATFYSYQEVERLLLDSGFRIDNVVSTLFQRPGEVHVVENPKEGYSLDAGFTIFVALKSADKSEK